MSVKPVILPPGRARLATKPSSDRVDRDAEDDRDRRSCLLYWIRGPDRDDDIDLQSDEIGCDSRTALLCRSAQR